MKFKLKADLISREELRNRMKTDNENIINSEKFKKVYDYVLNDIEKSINDAANFGNYSIEKGFWNYLDVINKALHFDFKDYIYKKELLAVYNKIAEKLNQLGYNAELVNYPSNSTKFVVRWDDEDSDK